MDGDDARLRELRATDPGGLVIVDFLDESDPADAALLRRSLTFPDTVVASDAVPPVWTGDARPDIRAWPLPPDAVTHPRTAGTFARALRLWRQEGTPVLEAVRRATLLPALVLEPSVPAMRRKGRVQVGADADLVVLDMERTSVVDPARFRSKARYSPFEGWPLRGLPVMTFVGGTLVAKDGEIVCGPGSGSFVSPAR